MIDFSRHAARAAEACARRPWRVLALALVLSIISLWAISKLPVLTSRQALLPQDTDVVRRFDSFLTKFGAASDLIVVLENAPYAELSAFGDDLADRLMAEPAVGRVERRIDTGFLLGHAYLLLSDSQLHGLAAALAGIGDLRGSSLESLLARAQAWVHDPPSLSGMDIGQAAQLTGVLTGFFEEWRRWLVADRPPEALDPGPLLTRVGAGEIAHGDFASRDRRMLFLFVHPRDPSADFASRGPFIDGVRAAIAASDARARAAGRVPPKVGLTGLPAAEYEEYIDIEQDILLVVATAAGLIGALILLVVRSFRWALAIFVPMGLGAMWSQALALLTVGHLTIVTSGFIAILFGLGADYGIFTSSRIAEERRAGRPLHEAIGRGIGASFNAVLTAGGASMAIFVALGTVEFPGFAELGRVAAGGVLLILFSTWMVQPALYALLPPRLLERPGDAAVGAPPMAGGRFPKPVAVVLVIVALGCALAGGIAGAGIPFDYDALALLPKDSEAAHYARRMVAESDYQSEVVIFTASDLDEARRIATAAGGLDSIAKLQSPTILFPADAPSRAEQARAIAAMLARKPYREALAEADRAGLSAAAFVRLRDLLTALDDLIDSSEEQAFSAGHASLVEALEQARAAIGAVRTEIDRDPERARQRTEGMLRQLLHGASSALDVIAGWRDAAPLRPDELPHSLRDRFFAEDGTIALYAFPAKSVYQPAELDHLIDQVYRVSPNATGFPTTSHAFSRLVVASFTHGTVLAVIVCLISLMLAVRDLRGFLLAALPLVIGGGWMLGIMAMAGLSYNYANIIALPLVIALAVDYGVWYSHRWRELVATHSPLAVTWVAGRVIALAAGTELAGLGAITLAHYRGVSTLGVNITIGLLCCLPATLLVAPAIGQLIYPRRV